MGWIGLIVMVGSIVVAATMGRRQMQQNAMKPATLDSFQVTQAKEGSVVPMVWGKVRLYTNILWYGNLTSEEIKASGGGGGKGFGGGAPEGAAGYDYYIDMWHAICQGPNVVLEGLYVQDKPAALSALGAYVLNDGDDTTFPTEPGPFATALRGVAHLWLPQYYLGQNTTSIPTLHLVVSRTSDAPLTYANMTNGVNPAAIIYDLLLAAGVNAADIDLASFQTAATYWYGKGYGLNIALDSRGELREHVNTVLSYVDGALQIDSSDKFVLKAFRSTDTYTTAIVTDEFKEFTFKRRTWEDVPSDFRATYTDESMDFSVRALRVINPAVMRLQDEPEQRSYTLTAFRDCATASARLWELMKTYSYPESQIDVTVGIKCATLQVGDVVRVTHDDYGIADVDYRVMSLDFGEIDDNSIRMSLTQMVESMLDNHYATAGGSSWIAPDYSPAVASYTRIFELPYTERYGEAPAYLLLVARAGIEEGFTALVSYTGTDYLPAKAFTSFSQRGVLGATYAATPLSIDDETGILYTPSRDDPAFDSISRTALFGTMRVALIDNELIAFQTVTPEGAGYRLGGCIRGILNTAVASHTVGATIWLTNLADNVLTDVLAASFYVKILPFFGREQIDAGAVSGTAVASTGIAAKPWPPSLLRVTKSASANVVKVWPTVAQYAGAGARDGAVQTDQDPPAYLGTFEYTTDGGSTVTTGQTYSFTVTAAGAVTIGVRANVNGRVSDWVSVSVLAADATYYGPGV
jgi:hypothetical protein